MMQAPPFWKTKSLEQMTPAEWESLCDGCGRCCLQKLTHATTQKVAYTKVACKMLDCHSGQCTDYQNRQELVPTCANLTPEFVRKTDWLPPSCGYVKIRDGKDLEWWHPLVSGTSETVHAAGISVRGRGVVSELTTHKALWESHIVDWPTEEPDGA